MSHRGKPGHGRLVFFARLTVEPAVISAVGRFPDDRQYSSFQTGLESNHTAHVVIDAGTA